MSQDVVDICLEMFNCVSAEQTVAKTRFFRRVSNSGSSCFCFICCWTRERTGDLI